MKLIKYVFLCFLIFERDSDLFSVGGFGMVLGVDFGGFFVVCGLLFLFIMLF